MTRLLCAILGHRYVNRWHRERLSNGIVLNTPFAECVRCKARGLYGSGK